ALSVQGVTVSFGGTPALDEVSLSVPTSSFVGLVGPNGAGKTTLINCISGIVKARSGRIDYRGRDVLAMPPHGRAAHGIGRTFQQAQLLDGLTCFENVLLGGFARAPWLGWFATRRLREGR